MEPTHKRKHEEEEEPDSLSLPSPEQSPKKKTAIMYPCADQRCTKSCVQKEGMECHLRDVHKDKYCFGCNKHFDNVSIGYHLLQVHQGVSERGKFRCSRCPGKKAFKKEQDLMDHVRWKHNGCAACGIFFKYHHSWEGSSVDRRTCRLEFRCRTFDVGWKFRRDDNAGGKTAVDHGLVAEDVMDVTGRNEDNRNGFYTGCLI